MNLLVLGNGYVGSWLFNHLFPRHFTTIIKREQLNYADKDILKSYIRTTLPDAIINCSGYTGSPNVDACETNKEDCWFYNVTAPLNVLQAADATGVPVLHVSSGCIYTGYEKEFTEDDAPNFGLYSCVSSYYSKCKHAFESIAKNYNVHIFRIRMPFDSTTHRKNYLYKLYKYDNLISLPNSITSMPDLCVFVEKFLAKLDVMAPGVYNVVNPGGVDAKKIISLLDKHGVANPNWNFIDIDELKTTAKRSNCILSTNKLKRLDLELPASSEILDNYVLQFSKNIQ